MVWQLAQLINGVFYWTTIIYLVTISIHPTQDLHSHITIIEESSMMLIQLPHGNDIGRHLTNESMELGMPCILLYSASQGLQWVLYYVYRNFRFEDLGVPGPHRRNHEHATARGMG